MRKYHEQNKERWQFIRSEYQSLLDDLTENPGQEKRMQSYLEKRPLLLPGIRGVYETTNHGVFNSIIFSQFPLQGSFRRIPDFVFVTKTSAQLQVVFIEIEDPSKKFFNQDDSFTSQFNKAYEQLEEWDTWFKHGPNQTLLRESINRAISHRLMLTLPIRAEYVLVYGRRSEFENSQKRVNKIDAKNRYPYKVMTFDRLDCEPFCESFITVKHNDASYYAIEVDEKYSYNESTRSKHKHINNKIEAVKNNSFMTTETKTSLQKEITFWDSMSDKEAEEYKLNRILKKYKK